MIRDCFDFAVGENATFIACLSFFSGSFSRRRLIIFYRYMGFMHSLASLSVMISG